MPADIIAFPTSENRFHRVIDRLERLAARFPVVSGDAADIAKELEKFVLALDQNLDVAYQALQQSRDSEVRALAWSEAIQEVCATDTRSQIQDAYQRRLAHAI